MGYNESHIEQALENIEFPDVQIAVDWIENNIEYLYELDIKQLEKQGSKEQSVDFKSKICKSVEEIGNIYIKYLMNYDGFENKISDFLLGIKENQS